MADGTDTPDPGEGRRDLDSLPPRQEGCRLLSRHEEGGRNPSAPGGPNENQVELPEEKVEEEAYFSPREPSPEQDSSEGELR